MVQYFKQMIYHHPHSLKNFPQNLTAQDLISGEIFKSYMPITQLGVRALPGTKFYINGYSRPVIIGSTGLFDIDLSAGGFIQSLAFDPKSLDLIGSNDTGYLVIDIAYLGTDSLTEDAEEEET